MDSQIILSHINQVVQLDEKETAFLESVLISRPFKQGEVIVKSGETARYIMYVNSGFVMTYYTDKQDIDHVVHFASTGWWAGDIYTLDKQTQTHYSTKGLCDGELLLIPRLAQTQLLKDYHNFERYFRILFQNAVIRQQLRFIESHSASAGQRYQSFIERYPGIEQHVPQKYIASYLGITPEFLSKVRKQRIQK